MAIARVVNNNGNLELETLSGAIASGLPLGTIISLPYLPWDQLVSSMVPTLS